MDTLHCLFLLNDLFAFIQDKHFTIIYLIQRCATKILFLVCDLKYKNALLKKDRKGITKPPANEVWGCIGITLSVSPSVCPCKIRVRSIFFVWRNIGSYYFTHRLLMT